MAESRPQLMAKLPFPLDAGTAGNPPGGAVGSSDCGTPLMVVNRGASSIGTEPGGIRQMRRQSIGAGGVEVLHRGRAEVIEDQRIAGANAALLVAEELVPEPSDGAGEKAMASRGPKSFLSGVQKSGAWL